MVRFILSPDGEITPDFSGRFPGRGAWVSASDALIDKAVSSGAFSRAFRQKASAPENLSALVGQGLTKSALAVLGMARRSGNAVTGYEKTRSATLGQKPVVLVLASDAGADGRRKFKSLRGAIKKVELFSRRELASALGQEDTVFAAIYPGPHTSRFVETVEKLAGFRVNPAE